MDKIISSLPTKPVSIFCSEKTLLSPAPSIPFSLSSPLRPSLAPPNLPNPHQQLPTFQQITTYTTHPTSTDNSHLGWIRPGDPRSELVLSLFKEGHGLPLLLNSIRPPNGRSWSTKPPADLIAAISPLSHLRRGTYTTPTFLIHGTNDEIVPYHTAVTFSEAIREKGVRGGLGEVKGVRHIHDLELREGGKGWWEGVGVGYAFLLEELGL